MTNPVPPPTESGWYVVEVEGLPPSIARVVLVRDVVRADVFGRNYKWISDKLKPSNGTAPLTITRYTGPLDLEKLLEGNNAAT